MVAPQGCSLRPSLRQCWAQHRFSRHHVHVRATAEPQTGWFSRLKAQVQVDPLLQQLRRMRYEDSTVERVCE